MHFGHGNNREDLIDMRQKVEEAGVHAPRRLCYPPRFVIRKQEGCQMGNNEALWRLARRVLERLEQAVAGEAEHVA